MKRWLAMVCVVVLLFISILGTSSLALKANYNSKDTVVKAGPVVPKPEPWRMRLG